MSASAGRMKVTRTIALLGLALAACITLLGNVGQVQAGAPSSTPNASRYVGKVERKVLNDTANGKSTQFMVLMSEQANLTSAYAMKDQDARGWYVYDTLTSFANRTQVPVRRALTQMGLSYQSFWAANALLVTGGRSAVDALAAMPEVGTIESNAPFKGLDDPVSISNSLITYSSEQPATIEWGVQRVNADQVWAMGYTGQGIVVANQDTGMRWTHNAIKPHYRGWNGSSADHNYNWHDSIHDSTGNPCGNDSPFPCDDHGHGTHTTGTTTGDDGAGNQIGVAPGAKWIGCRNMDAGTGTPARYTECFQFFIAPTDLNGQNPNPALRPHVMNNSWGCPASEGCAATTLNTILESTQAAGIFVEASNGINGPGCSSVDTSGPPALTGVAFSTGALDINNTVASFSSRGPVTSDGSNRRKPDISGPGVNVRSSVNTSDTAYANFSGTSMAGPHVVGVVALLWSAHPELSRAITETKHLLENTASSDVNVAAQTCGGIPSTQVPNNQFGYGRVDALAAVSVPITTPTAIVTNTPTHTPTATPVVSVTPCVSVGTWTEQAPMTDVRGRALGLTIGNNVFVFGGRPEASTYAQEIFKYDITANSWIQLSQLLPDNQTSNMVGGVLTFPQGQMGFIVGGNGPGSAYTGRTLAFNPADNSLTPKATWPASPIHLPGGAAVVNNKLYIFGGINASAGSPAPYDEIWMYDPMTDTWSLIPTVLSVARGYIATEAMPNGLIYVAGGSQPDGSGGLTDETVFEIFNPANNSIQTGPPLPVGTSNNQGYNVNGKFYVVAGGFNLTAPDVQVYDPNTGTWGTDTPAIDTVRNYAKGYGPNGSIFAIGGNDASGSTFFDNTQKFTPGGACTTPTVTLTVIVTSTPTATTQAVTHTATSTATTEPGSPTVTSTPCTINFSDVHTTDYFYEDVRCVYCLGAVSGYADGTFRPFNNTTRGQMTKIIVLALRIPIATPTGTPTFNDVPAGSTFYDYVETAAGAGIVSGYADGTFRPNNNVTRGQLSKIDVIAANQVFSWTILNPATPTFSDVAPGSAFYEYVETAVCHGIISGYSDGTFRPNNNAIRAQIAKIVCRTSQNPPDNCTGTATPGAASK